MQENKNITSLELENEILKNNNAERKTSDEKYAPMNVKNIVYGFIGAITFGLLIGVVNVVINAIISKL